MYHEVLSVTVLAKNLQVSQKDEQVYALPLDLQLAREQMPMSPKHSMGILLMSHLAEQAHYNSCDPVNVMLLEAADIGAGIYAQSLSDCCLELEQALLSQSSFIIHSIGWQAECAATSRAVLTMAPMHVWRHVYAARM